MSAPALSRRSVVARLSSSVKSSAGTAISAGRAARQQHEQRVVLADGVGERQRHASRLLARHRGHRVPPTIASNPSDTAAGSGLITRPRRTRTRSATAFAIGAAAFPAARHTCRAPSIAAAPSARSTRSCASTAAMPARTMARRSWRSCSCERVSGTFSDRTRLTSRSRRRIA